MKNLSKSRLKRMLKEFLFGAFYFDLYKDSVKLAKSYNDFIYLIVLGEILGVPIMSTYYTLRLVPYIYKDLILWKTRQLKERDITEEAPDLGI